MVKGNNAAFSVIVPFHESSIVLNTINVIFAFAHIIIHDESLEIRIIIVILRSSNFHVVFLVAPSILDEVVDLVY